MKSSYPTRILEATKRYNKSVISLLLILFPVIIFAQKADFTADKTTVCSGSTVVFTNISTGILEPATYSWDFGANAEPLAAVGQGPHTVVYTGIGSSTVSLIITTAATIVIDEEIKDSYIIRVANAATILLSSANNTQTVCRNTAISNITYTIGGSGTGATVTGLPTGVTGEFSGGTFTISGTPTETGGIYAYTVTTTGPCSNTTATGTITVTADATINLTSANNTQTVCRNTAISNITYTIGGSGMGATVTGLPTGVTGIFSSGTFTISGTPTVVGGTFNYTVTTAGLCANTTATGTITVRPDATITLTSANNTQTVCRNAAITNIIYTIGGSGTGATVAGLPTGVTGVFSSGTFTISGTPTVVGGIYAYTVTTTGPCSNTTATGTITVRPDATITLTSANNTQTVCSNTPISNITYTIGGSGTGATVTGLPAGVTGVFSGGTFTIDGTTTVVAGNYDYTVSTTGPCVKTEAKGTLVVSPLPKASISGTTSVCQFETSPSIVFTGSMGVAPYTFTYTINSGSVITATTVSGNSVSLPVPTNDAATYTYSLLSVRDSSPSKCIQAQSGSATIVVNSLPTASISGTIQICEGSNAPNIIFTGNDGKAPYTFYYSINGGATHSVTSISGKTATVSAPANVPGVFTYELLSVSDASTSTCNQIQTGSAIVTVNPLPKGQISGTNTVCLYDAPVEVLFTGSSGTAPYTFTYTINDGNLNTITTSNGNSITVAAPTDVSGVFIYKLISVRDQSSTRCESLISGSATINVSTLPTATITGTTTICRGSMKPKVIFAGFNGKTPYTFTYRVNNGAEQSITTQQGNTVSIEAPTDVAGAFRYEILSVQDGKSNPCTNAQTGSVTIQIKEIPVANPGVGGNNCGLRYNLNAQFSIEDATGKWSLTSGPGNATFDPAEALAPNTEVTVDAFGTYEFTWTEVNGPCTDQASIKVRFFQIPSGNAGRDTLICYLEYTLDALLGTETGSWSMFEGPGEAKFSPNPRDPSATVTVNKYGIYQFQWTEINDVCQSNDLVKVIFQAIPTLSVGRDTTICLGDEVQLQAVGEGTFLWSPVSSLNDPNISNPMASPVVETVYQITLTDINGCVNKDKITVSPIHPSVVYAGKDTTLYYLFTYNTRALEIEPTETGQWMLTHRGTGIFSDSTKPINMISGLSVGENVFEWVVSNGVCPDAHDFLTITVKDLLIPTLITPNKDGINDKFVIRGLVETLGKTELIIFDRRGLQVYKNKDYDNEWEGEDQNGQPLPEDTYYFSINPTNEKPISGYIVIRR